MENNQALSQYISDLVERVYGEELDDDAKSEARAEMYKAFMQLYNKRLVDKFSDDQLDKVEELAQQNRLDEISKLAYNNGINLTSLVVEVAQEFQRLYAPGLEDK